jgi:hypothetical protein
MDLHDDFDPRQHDLALVCKDDKVVHAHSYLLMLASIRKTRPGWLSGYGQYGAVNNVHGWSGFW